MRILTVIKKISNLGINESLNTEETKRVLLINRLLALLALTGVLVLIPLGLTNALPVLLTGFVLLLTLLYIIALYLSSKGNYLFGTYLMLIGGNVAITTTIILIGEDSYAQLMFLMVAGLPYLICDSKLGNFRLYISTSVIPLWLIAVFYANSHEPYYVLSEEIKTYIRFTFILMTTSFSTFLLYHFNKLSEKQVAIIKEQTKRLEAKNNALQQYNHMVSHDLKTPIANIEGFFSLLQLDLETDDEEIKEYMTGIENGIIQANNTIKEVIIAIKSINFLEEMTQVDLNKATEQVKKNLSQLLKVSNAKIICDYSQCAEVRFGELDMKSILQNLISNSLKYAKPDVTPLIEIKSHIEKKYCIISVKDNGLGIDMAKDGEKLFNMYERIHVNNAEGTGVGLSMIKKIIELRGGIIEVESELGIGSNFKVHIPNNIFS